jgi:AraC family transcriptional regulator
LLSQTRDNYRQLLPGEHYGSISASRDFNEFSLTESIYAKSSVTPPHAHHADCLSLFLGGSFLEEFKASTLDCARGTILFRPACEIHRDHVGAKGAHCLIIELSASFTLRMNEVGLRQDAPIKAHDLEDVLRRVYKEWVSGDELSHLVLESLILEIACHLNRARKKEASTPRWLKLADDYLRANFCSPISLGEVAAEAEVHPAHLARAFRQHHGRTVGEYVRQLRITFACEQLQSTNLNLADLTLAAGFANQAHFSRVFKSLTGFTPGAYRQAKSPNATPR